MVLVSKEGVWTDSPEQVVRPLLHISLLGISPGLSLTEVTCYHPGDLPSSSYSRSHSATLPCLILVKFFLTGFSASVTLEDSVESRLAEINAIGRKGRIGTGCVCGELVMSAIPRNLHSLI